MKYFKSFIKQFTIPEFKSISGKNYRNIIIISIIFFFSLLSICIAKSITNYLDEKMNDPFIKFVNVKIPYQNKIDWRNLRDSSLKNRFGYSDVNPIYYSYTDFANKDLEPVNAKVRKISEKSVLLNYILNDKNILITDRLSVNISDNDYGIIVSESYFSKLGYKDYQNPYLFLVKYINKKPYYIPIPVKAVVTQLPGYVDMLVSPKVYNALKHPDQILDLTKSEQTNYLRIYYFNNTNLLKGATKINIKPQSPYAKGVIHEFRNLKYPDKVFDSIKNAISGNNSVIRLYDLDRTVFNESRYIPQVDYISLSFNNPDSIYVFRDFIKEKYDIKIDMNKIQAKRNFDLFNKTAQFLSLLIAIFSSIGIILFVSNIIIAHIDKNKKNLGTLKAFGLSNNSIVNIYTLLSFAIIAISFFVAFVITLISGNLILHGFINLFDISINSGVFCYNYLCYPLWIILVLYLIIPLIFIYLNLWGKIKNQTPGDLIYERV